MKVKTLLLTMGGVATLALATVTVAVVELTAPAPEHEIGPVQTDLAPLALHCPGVAEAVDARWRFWEVGAEDRPESERWRLDVPGPVDYEIEALVTLPEQAVYTLRWGHQWKPAEAPHMSAQLTSQPPAGVWWSATAEPCPGYVGRVYRLDGTSTVYFDLTTQ
ncbi:hypothetical protein [Rhizocola hellebori]|nr:hypothetical protein [Rhizocola hellebori]